MFCTKQLLLAEEVTWMSWMKTRSTVRETQNHWITAQIYECLYLQSRLSYLGQATLTAQMRVMRTHQMFYSTFYKEGTTHGSILGHKLPSFVFVHNLPSAFPVGGMQIRG
jgi:hypothetical protein